MGRGASISSFVSIIVNPLPPITLFDGEDTGSGQKWKAKLRKLIGSPIYPELRFLVQQTEYDLAGGPLANAPPVEADVLVGGGTVDGDGNITLRLHVVRDNVLLTTLDFTGTVAGTGLNQVMGGSYVVAGGENRQHDHGAELTAFPIGSAIS